jgi:hypothetical protein
LEEIAVADELFVCEAEPPPELEFVAPRCVDAARESASWFVTADCASACDWPPEEPAPPTWLWSTSCVVELAFEEIAVADDVFVCVAAPPPVFVFVAPR